MIQKELPKLYHDNLPFVFPPFVHYIILDRLQVEANNATV